MRSFVSDIVEYILFEQKKIKCDTQTNFLQITFAFLVVFVASASASFGYGLLGGGGGYGNSYGGGYGGYPGEKMCKI